MHHTFAKVTNGFACFIKWMACIALIPLLISCSNSNPDDTTVDAFYSKGPVDAARATLVDSNGNIIAGPVSTVRGKASFPNITFNGPVYARFAGGFYTDEATNTPVLLSSSFVIRSGIINTMTPGRLNIVATPLTEIAFRRAENAAAGNLDLNDVNAFVDLLADEYGLDGINLTTTPPSTFEAIDGTSENDRYGTVLAAITQQIKDEGGTPGAASLAEYIDDTVTTTDETALIMAISGLGTNPITVGKVDEEIITVLNDAVGAVEPTDPTEIPVVDTTVGTIPPTAPQNVSAVAGNAQALIIWDTVRTATAYDICSATETITTPENCASHTGGALITDKISPVTITGLSNGTEYFFIVIPKNTGGDGDASTVVSVTVGLLLTTSTGKLNDTGITLCGDYAYGAGSGIHNNDLNCSLTLDSNNDSIPEGQDPLSGRDANTATNTDTDGHKGFSYTKLDSNGVILSDQSATTFNCVKDEVTGLIWEVKQTTPGLHSRVDSYTWYNTDNTTNGGSVGEVSANTNCEGNFNNTCNTQAYVERVNAASLCGATDWRLPTVKELDSLLSYDLSNPSIDAQYFPNTTANFFWSSTTDAANSARTWIVAFFSAGSQTEDKNTFRLVRLVRSGQ